MRLLVNVQSLSTFDCLFRQRKNISSRPKGFFDRPTILSYPNFPKWLRTSFYKTSLESLRFLIYTWKFQIKKSLTPRKLRYTLQKSYDLKPRSLEISHHFLIRPGNTAVWSWCFPVNINIKILVFNAYINMEASAPHEKHFPPSDTLSSELILGSSWKKIYRD